MNAAATRPSETRNVVKTHRECRWLHTAFATTSSCHSAAMTGWKLLPQASSRFHFTRSEVSQFCCILGSPSEAQKFSRQLFWGGPGAPLYLKALQVILTCSQGCEPMICSHSCCLRFPCLLWHPLLMLPEWSFCNAYRIKFKLLSTGSALKYLTSCLTLLSVHKLHQALVSYMPASASGPEHWLISCSEMLSSLSVYLSGECIFSMKPLLTF